jgi:hypothetical protein
MNTQLSIIIVNYNTAKYVVETVQSLIKSYPKQLRDGTYEIIVSDNNSPDTSVADLQHLKRNEHLAHITILANKKNLGFSKGNNEGVKIAKGEYILFLNPDTIVGPEALPALITYLQEHPDTGMVTCQLNLPSGGIDEASHRGFPTPWNSLCYFSGLIKLFPRSRLFAGYTQGWKDLHVIHEVDAVAGAFMLLPRSVGEKIGWWDEDFFFYGEDIDLCYRVKREGYKIIYNPTVSITHVGGVTAGIKRHTANITTANATIKMFSQKQRFESMRIFYRKHYQRTTPAWINWLVMKGIALKEYSVMRVLKRASQG